MFKPLQIGKTCRLKLLQCLRQSVLLQDTVIGKTCLAKAKLKPLQIGIPPASGESMKTFSTATTPELVRSLGNEFVSYDDKTLVLTELRKRDALLPNWRKAAAATYDRLAVLALSDEEQAKWLRRKREVQSS